MYHYIRGLRCISTRQCSPRGPRKSKSLTRVKGDAILRGPRVELLIIPKVMSKGGKAFRGTKLELPVILNSKY